MLKLHLNEKEIKKKKYSFFKCIKAEKEENYQIYKSAGVWASVRSS